ncbi:hypothetical protein B0H16DRAFT_1592429 [Mycena metata]|uniref:Uncharacterized protein n=1 Tax=Mycena metata TaxID=1033252 RepID=A0AAD7MP80_9AGAR|nr:hypothetical protein B0H16DRAFT_1592429 [Mycena metata]
MATELKERDDDGRSHRSHRSHRHQDQDDDSRSHRSRRDSHRSREDADRDRDRRRHHSHSPERRSSRHDKDRPHSRSSHHEHREHDHDKDNVKAPAYPPDFLRLYSPAGSIGGNDKFDVITGAEAVEFTRQFIRDQAADGTTLPGALADALPASSTTPPSGAPLPLMAMAKSPSATSHKSLTNHSHLNALDLHKGGGGSKRLHPVVFALPRSATNTGKKVVDFYMTWRGKTKTHPLKGPSRRANFLDNEFRRVRETLDGEWRRAGRAIKGGFGAGSTTSDAPLPVLMRAPTDPQPQPRLPPEFEFARESGPAAPGPAARSVSDPLPLPSSFPINTDPARPPMGTHRGSVDSLNSVTSIPYLGAVRGVPGGNRAPLRVTNPGDRMSMSSSSDSFGEMLKPKPVKGSPLRDGVAFDVAEEEVPAPSTHVLQLPGRTSSDSSSGSSRKSKSRKDGKEREKEKSGAEDGDKEKILIVLLDGDAGKNKGEKKGRRPDSDTTWHGLERRFSAPSSRKPSPSRPAHDSPWLGPLVKQNEDVTFIHTPTDHFYSDDDEDDDSGDWKVVPVKNLLSQMGYLAPEAAVLGRASPSPYGSYAALPTPYGSPYTMGAARQLAASYSSPYVSPAQGAGSPYGQLQLRPPSRPQTPTSYYAGGTPQQQQPPWASPGGGGPVYPPTNYSSPAPGPYVTPTPGVYAGPYPSAASGGYMSPEGAAYASPYASPAPGIYTNLAAGYSSPYVPPLQAPRGSPSFYYN